MKSKLSSKSNSRGSARDEAWGHRETSFWYETSSDGGASWSPARQIIHRGGGYDERRWMPGITTGLQNTSADQGPFAQLDDGTVLFGFTVHHQDKPYSVAFLRGTWGAEELEWEMSEELRVPETVSRVGVCEPDLLFLGGQRLFTTMRCQGSKEKGVFSTRQCSVSEDGGKRWSAPEPLRYDDGEIVPVPASIAAFERDPKTGKAYWFANILEAPVCGQVPRYPLTIAELDPERLCIKRDTVTVIQDLPEGAPAVDDERDEPGRRYSNFGHYTDRKTGEFVLMMAEEPKVSWDDGTADCIRFRVKVPK